MKTEKDLRSGVFDSFPSHQKADWCIMRLYTGGIDSIILTERESPPPKSSKVFVRFIQRERPTDKRRSFSITWEFFVIVVYWTVIIQD